MTGGRELLILAYLYNTDIFQGPCGGKWFACRCTKVLCFGICFIFFPVTPYILVFASSLPHNMCPSTFGPTGCGRLCSAPVDISHLKPSHV